MWPICATIEILRIDDASCPARHFDCAQSVTSELVDRLMREGLVARIRDQRDRSRTRYWRDHGKLQSFEERFERMVQWQMRQNPKSTARVSLSGLFRSAGRAAGSTSLTNEFRKLGDHLGQACEQLFE